MLAGLAAAVCVVLLVVVVEVGLRLTSDKNRFYPHHPGTVKVMYPSEEVTPGISDPSYVTANSFGARGPELGDQPIRILTIGGSTTACTALDDGEAWPALLMEELNEKAGDDQVWVTNSGIDGHTSQHHLMHVKYFLPQLPPMTHVIVYAGVNDAGNWLYVSDWDPNYLDDPDNWNARLAESFRFSNFTPPEWPWYKHLELWRRASLMKARFQSLQVERERERGRIQQDENFEWMREERQRRAEAAKVQVHRAKMETLDAALESYARNLVQIIELSRAQGAEPILMAQALDHLILDAEERRAFWMGAMDGGETYAREEQMRELIAAFNQRMREVAAEEKVLFVDLPALLHEERELFYDGLHFNEHGARTTARVLGDVLWPSLRGGADSNQAGAGESPGAPEAGRAGG